MSRDVVDRRPPPPPLRLRNRRQARSLLELIASHAGARIDVAPELRGQVALELGDTSWREALVLVAAAAGEFVVVEAGQGALRVVRRAP